jgi:methylated-DNA-[protein]-cysteine S-methyltransferase
MTMPADHAHVDEPDAGTATDLVGVPRRRLLAGPPARAARAAVKQARVDTPLGPVTLAATDRGLCGLWFDGQRHHPGPLDAPHDPQQRHLACAIAELEAYWGGKAAAGRATDERPGGTARWPGPRAVSMPFGFTVPVDLIGTPFQRAVWTTLRRIEPGCTVTYAQVAQACGHAAAVRAVGVAIGRNPLSIVVPCHRVVGSDGSLTGYAGGLDRKQRLLALEVRRGASPGSTAGAAWGSTQALVPAASPGARTRATAGRRS